jgi:hypothetical protein
MSTHTVVVDINMLGKVLPFLEMPLLVQRSVALLLEKQVEPELKKESSFNFSLKLISSMLNIFANGKPTC